MNEPQRLARYRKDPALEARMRSVNLLLEPLERERLTQYGRPGLPIIFIVGLPRSGTTLLSQVLAEGTSLGYISNFLACFWLAPGIGAEIEQALGVRQKTTLDQRKFHSEYGVTEGWGQPHEFGYFWDRWFELGQETHYLTDQQLELVDADQLRRSIASIEAAMRRPLAFKNNSWCTMMVPFLNVLFPDAFFFVCERNPLSVCQSIMQARLRRFGDLDAWWSIRPAEYRELLGRPWWEQIAGQVFHISSTMERGLESIHPSRVVRIGYESLCVDPRETVRSVVSRVGIDAGAEIARLPRQFNASRGQKVDDDDLNRLAGALAALTG